MLSEMHQENFNAFIANKTIVTREHFVDDINNESQNILHNTFFRLYWARNDDSDLGKIFEKL